MRTLTLTDFPTALPEQPVPVLLLVHTEVLDPPQRRAALLSGSFVIGRDVSAERGLSLPLDRRASRHHTELSVTAGTVQVRDLESKNGTFLNGTRVQTETMKDGDVLRVGNSLLVLRYEPAQVLDAPASEHEIHEKLRGESLAIRETTFNATPLPVYPFKFVIPLAGGMLLLQGIVEIVRCIQCLRDGDWPSREADVEEVDVDKLKEMVHVKDEDIAALDKYVTHEAGSTK